MNIELGNGAKTTLKLIVIIIMTILFLIPVSLITGLVRERAERRNEAINGVLSQWGGRQEIAGPILRLPYVHVTEVKETDGTVRRVREIRYLWVLPETLKVDGDLQSEVRTRGIFKVPLYRGVLGMEGSFRTPDLERFGLQASQIIWEDVRLLFDVSGRQGLADMPRVLLNGRSERPEFLGTGAGFRLYGGFAVPAPLQPEGELSFAIDVEIKGGEEIALFPLAESNTLRLRSDWPSPGFFGGFPPEEHQVTDEGFTAIWRVPGVARSLPSAWKGADYTPSLGYSESIRTRFIVPVDTYHMTERSVKYAILFVLVPFVGFFLCEVLLRIRIHPIQYLLVGSEILVFYLLLLSLAERLGFGLAYGLAAAAVTVTLAFYGATVVRRRLAGIAIGGLFALCYGVLYFIVRTQDNALLLGSFFTFAILAAFMAATRRVDWYALKSPNGPKSGR